jgi:primosomal protein N''
MNVPDVSPNDTDTLALHRKMYERRLRKVQQEEEQREATAKEATEQDKDAGQKPKLVNLPDR